MKIKSLFILILLSVVALSSPTMVPVTQQAVEPSAALSGQLGAIISLLVPLMILMVVLAAVVYAVGQMFGAETRARASVWAKSMLTAVLISAVLFVLLFYILGWVQQVSPSGVGWVSQVAPPGVSPSGLPQVIGDPFLNLIQGIGSIAHNALVAIIFLFVIVAALVYALGQMAGAETRARATVWATGLLAGALLAAVIYVIFFEIISNMGASLFVGMAYGLEQYGTVVIAVAFFVTSIILITYLMSRFFQVPEWEAYLNIELSNLAGSFLVLVFVLALFATGDIFSFIVTGKSSAPVAAVDFLVTKVANNVFKGLYDVFRIQTCTSMLSVFSRRIGEAVLTNVFKIFPGVDVFVQITNVIGYGLVSIYGSLKFQILALNIADAFMLKFFLPAGLILRFFPPTRDAGSFLIAVAFAFQFVFPMTYMINAQVLDYLQIKTYEEQHAELIIQSLCGPFKYGVFGVLFNPGVVPGISAFPQLQMVFKAILSEVTLNLVSMAEFVPILKSLAVLSLFALFIPAFALVITIAFINAMTKFLTTKL